MYRDRMLTEVDARSAIASRPTRLPMRILVCSAYPPFPPQGGGRADIWRRIEAMVKLGHSVMLLHPYDEKGTLASNPDQLSAMDTVLAARYSYPLTRSGRRTIGQLLALTRLPWHSAAARPTPEQRAEADRAVDAFDPDVIWLDGPWGGELAVHMSDRHGAPLIYRSHNVEHTYLRKQARASRRLRQRVSWTLAAVGAKRYQLRLMRRAARVVDISVADRDYWRRYGIDAVWLPPFPAAALADAPPATVPSELLFVGGLSLPNNINGLRWLIDGVLPTLLAERPETTLTVVGSSPKPDVRRWLGQHPAVTTHYDVPNVASYLFGARVLVNPVSIGSGVQLKMLDMLMTDAPVITRRQGVVGLPADVEAACVVADDVETFTAAARAALSGSASDPAARERARALFSPDALERILDEVHAEATSAD